MKRLFLVIALCFGIVAAYAQDQKEKSAIDFKNEGNEALRSKNYPQALKLYEEALSHWKDEPKDTAMVYNLAYCAYQTKSFEKAIKYFDEAISLGYKKDVALLYKANAYKLMNNEDAYVKTLEEALVSQPNNMKVKQQLAIVYLKQANVFYTNGAKILKAAADDVTAKKYKTTDPQYKEAETKADAEFKKALPIIEKALTYDPNNETGKKLKEACQQTIKG